MSLRQLFVGIALAVSTSVVAAPATAQMMTSEELNAPLTLVSELAKPISNSQPQETEEQFPKVSELQEQEIEAATVIQPAQLEVVTTGTSKDRSQIKSLEYKFDPALKLTPFQVEPSQPLEPSRVVPVQQREPSPVVEKIEQSQPLEPSRVTQQRVEPQFVNQRVVNQAPVQFAPEVTYDFNLEFGKSSTPNLEPETAFSLDRETKTKVNQIEPSRVTQQNKPTASNNIVPFHSKRRVVNQTEPSRVTQQKISVLPALEPSRVTNQQPIARNNIVPFSRERLVNQTEPSQPVVRSSNQTGVTATLEAPESLNRTFGISYTGVTPETAYSLDRELSTPASPIKRTQNSTTQSRNTSVRSVSNRAIDLGGTVTVQQPQPVVVETQQQTKPEPKPRPKGNLSIGISGIGGQAPVLETSAGIEYDGFSTTVSLNHPLDGQGQDTVGLATTLPISDRAKLTVKADQINIDPTISATVESKISNLTTSASFNNINRPDFNVELAGSYQISQHWSTNASFNVTTRQLNLGATYTGRGFDATVKVDSIAENPQLGVGLGIELSASTKLELNASNINGDPTFGVKVTQSFSF
jgi:hypothetical protein